ncbi:MAG: phage tail protein [Symbiobacteriaceae bacterium]|jgi:phage tail-like protein|nr:phage tail protein [Symbiobacteriaceae bacterium]
MPQQPLLTAFNFLVETVIHDGNWVCRAGFSECDGLEITMDPRTIREGGNNARAIHLPGPISYGQLTLRRGLSEDDELWNWFEAAHNSVTRKKRQLRADTTILVQSPDRAKSATFVLLGVTPVGMKGPALDAVHGGVAVEELRLAYEMMYRR